MTGYLETCGGTQYELPALLRWEMSYTGGVPCDSFSVTCLYDPKLFAVLPEVCRFSAVHGGKTVFRGVTDEYAVGRSEAGETLTVTGRGLAALLVDNEAEAVSYQTATLREIVRNHVAPYGIVCGTPAAIRSGEYRVMSGGSQWRALSRFTEYFGGFTPRFTPVGKLLLTPPEAGTALTVGPETPVLGLRWAENRYGVFSEVLVKDKVRDRSLLVENKALKARGGSCRRVVYMPSRSSYAAMRYTGEYQIARSAEEQLTVEIKLPGLFLAFPGDTAELSLAGGIQGSFTVREAESRADESGGTCTLTLGKRKES